MPMESAKPACHPKLRHKRYRAKDNVSDRPGAENLSVRVPSPEPDSPVRIVRPPGHFRGLLKWANTCNMNVVIQLMYNLDCFALCFVCEIRERKQPLPKDSLRAGLKLMYQILAQSPERSTLNPKCFWEVCQKHMPAFTVYSEEDVHEFFFIFLEKIDDEFKSEQNVSGNLLNPTINFRCEVKSVQSCMKCDNVKNSQISVRFLALPLPEDAGEAQIIDIAELIDIYFRTEMVDQKCVKCGAEKMKSDSKIDLLPRVLVLQILRYSVRNSVVSKVGTHIKFTESLNLKQWCYDTLRSPCELGAKMYNSKESGNGAACVTTYFLYGVVSHFGKSLHNGDYTVDIYDRQYSKYVRCDDILIREVSPEDVFCAEASPQLTCFFTFLTKKSNVSIRDGREHFV